MQPCTSNHFLFCHVQPQGTRKAMLELIRRVHPDFFREHPTEQTTNEKSFKVCALQYSALCSPQSTSHRIANPHRIFRPARRHCRPTSVLRESQSEADVCPKTRLLNMTQRRAVSSSMWHALAPVRPALAPGCLMPSGQQAEATPLGVDRGRGGRPTASQLGKACC